MPVGRIVLKSISGSKKLSKLKTDGARLLYTWLIPHLDVNGCFIGDPVVINGQVLSRLNKSLKTVQEYLADLEQNRLIVLYSANGDDFLFVPDFVEKQPNLRPEREGKTTIPIPTPDQLRSNSSVNPAEVKLKEVKLSKDKLTRAGEEPIKLSFGEFVTLTEDEHQKLISKFGKDKTDKMIDILDNAKGAKGYKYKSDYRAILSWVVDKVEKEEGNQGQGTKMGCKQCGDNGQYAGIDETGLCTSCRIK